MFIPLAGSNVVEVAADKPPKRKVAAVAAPGGEEPATPAPVTKPNPALASLSSVQLLKRNNDAHPTSVYTLALKKAIHPWILANQQENEEAIETYYRPKSTQVLDSQDMMSATPSPQITLSDFQKRAKAEV
jgi:hypothetical protein